MRIGELLDLGQQRRKARIRDIGQGPDASTGKPSPTGTDLEDGVICPAPLYIKKILEIPRLPVASASSAVMSWRPGTKSKSRLNTPSSRIDAG